MHYGYQYVLLQCLLITQFFFHPKVGPGQTGGLVPISGAGSRDKGIPTTNTCVNTQVIWFDKKSCLKQNGNQFLATKILSKEALMSRPAALPGSTRCWGRTTESRNESWWRETKTFLRTRGYPLYLQKRKITHRRDIWTDAPHFLLIATRFVFPLPFTHYPPDIWRTPSSLFEPNNLLTNLTSHLLTAKPNSLCLVLVWGWITSTQNIRWSPNL